MEISCLAPGTNDKEDAGEVVVDAVVVAVIVLLDEFNGIKLFKESLGFMIELDGVAIVGVGIGVGVGLILEVESFNFLLFGLFIAVEIVLSFIGGSINELILLATPVVERLVLNALLFNILLLKSIPELSLFTVSSILNNLSLSSGVLLFKKKDGSP
jgi:hypothetical protein